MSPCHKSSLLPFSVLSCPLSATVAVVTVWSAVLCTVRTSSLAPTVAETERAKLRTEDYLTHGVPADVCAGGAPPSSMQTGANMVHLYCSPHGQTSLGLGTARSYHLLRRPLVHAIFQALASSRYSESGCTFHHNPLLTEPSRLLLSIST